MGLGTRLGGFLNVVVLIVTLMLARELTVRAYIALGEPDPNEAADNATTT